MLRYADKCHDPDLSEHLCHRRRNPARTLAHTALSFSKKARQDGPRVLRYAQPFLVFSRHPLELLSKPLSLGWPVRRTGCSFLPNQRFVSRLYGLDVGVEESHLAAGNGHLAVAPNPANTLTHLAAVLPEGMDEAKLRVLDPLGRLVLEQVATGSVIAIDLDTRQLAGGIYSVALSNGAYLLGITRFEIIH